jgi:predicted nicotinamide N-methyase
MAFLDNMLKNKLAAIAAGKNSSAQGWERETDLKSDRYAEGRFSYDLADGRKVSVSESFEDLGSRVWDTCTLMCKLFESSPEIIRGKRILEVGAGTGLLGMVLAKLGAEHVILTDRNTLVPNIQKQLIDNGIESALAAANTLDWKDWESSPLIDQPFDLIVGSDIAMNPQLVPCLVSLLVRIKCTDMYLGSVKQREGWSVLLEALNNAGFSVEQLRVDHWSSRVGVVRVLK